MKIESPKSLLPVQRQAQPIEITKENRLKRSNSPNTSRDRTILRGYKSNNANSTYRFNLEASNRGHKTGEIIDLYI